MRPLTIRFMKTHIAQTRNTPRFVKKFSQAYSRFVNLMKFLFACGCSSPLFLVFLWPNFDSDDLKFQLGFATINFEIGSQPSMINPRYHGADEKSTIFGNRRFSQKNRQNQDSQVQKS